MQGVNLVLETYDNLICSKENPALLLELGQTKAPLPEKLQGDNVRLKHVLVNLTKNALKYSQQNSVTIRAAYNAMTQMLLVHVCDEGRGLDEESLG